MSLGDAYHETDETVISLTDSDLAIQILLRVRRLSGDGKLGVSLRVRGHVPEGVEYVNGESER